MSAENKFTNMVCLYIFTHNITKLKYFGKTINSFTNKKLLKYGGSGRYWSNHKKIHGNDLSVKIYGIYKILEVEVIALKFSEDNNIVKALNESGSRKGKKMWANEIAENGLDGGGIIGLKQSEETIRKRTDKTRGMKRKPGVGKQVSERQKGSNNPLYNPITFYNSLNEPVFTSLFRHPDSLKNLGIPKTILNTLKTKEGMYFGCSPKTLSYLKNNGNLKFKGWYAKYSLPKV